jgi:hypothetical protein
MEMDDYMELDGDFDILFDKLMEFRDAEEDPITVKGYEELLKGLATSKIILAGMYQLS